MGDSSTDNVSCISIVMFIIFSTEDDRLSQRIERDVYLGSRLHRLHYIKLRHVSLTAFCPLGQRE